MQHIVSQSCSTEDDRPIHFYSSSGGNAGLACVTAATSLGYRSSVVVPISTEESMIAKLRSAGATEVIAHGDSWIYADEYLRKTIMPEAEKRGEKGVYVPPFDHPDIWAGAGSMVEEMKKQMPDGEQPDAIVCSVGGGGLFAGIMNGLDHVGCNSQCQSAKAVQVLAVETLGADSLAQSVEKRELITLPGISSVAKSLGAVRVADHAFKQALRPNVSTIVLEDAEACMACWRFADDERFLVEPACGASVALAYDGRLKKYLKGFGPESKVVIVVCGGSRISLELLEEYKRTYGPRLQELGLSGGKKDVPSTYTA